MSLAPSPLANAFVSGDDVGKEQALLPLDIFLCRTCGHVQLLDVVDPAVLFQHYLYVSGTSPIFVDHFRRYARDVRTKFEVPRGALVVDIGSNDGTLLGFFRDAGMRVLGVDPATEIAQMATQAGIETLPVFFTTALAGEIRATHGAATVVTANNVLAHVDNLHGIVDGVRQLLTPDGIFVFEVSYLVDVYRHTLFDTIYHEHLSYHAVRPLREFFARHGMEMVEVTRVNTHGGSLRGVVQLAGGPREAGASVDDLVALERDLGLDRPEAFRTFAEQVERRKAQLQGVLRRLKSQGKRIAAFGAPAKATTLMYHFGIGGDLLDFIVDDSPLKQGLYSPGHHIPVLPASAIDERRPDYLLILAWNFADSIIGNHRAFLGGGGRFIVPLPQVRIVAG